MTTISIILICCVIIYLVWNYFELVKLFDIFKENRNEFDIKIFNKFVDIENDLLKLKDWKDWTDGKTYSLENNYELLNKNNFERLSEFDRKIDKNVIELNTEIQKIKKSKQKIKINDFDNLVQRVEKLELEIAAPAFNSYKIFIAELENHKSKIRTSKGRVSLNKELIENMIKDGKLEYFKSYNFADLQTIFMEYLGCKKSSTTSKIFRLTEKGLFKRYRSEKGSLWSVNI